MKKIIIALTAMVAVVTLSSFVISEKTSFKSNIKDYYSYYTHVTVWESEDEHYTEYVYYHEENGGRRYATSTVGPNEVTSMYYNVYKNPLYQSNSCNDFRRKYRYMCGPSHARSYFNCNLPYFIE